jgi:capsular polysaccharide biosynthesis protein
MELRRFINSIIRMLWLIILLGAIGGAIATYMTNYNNVSMYYSETTIYTLNKVSSVSNENKINYQDILLSRQLINDYQDIIKSEKVITMAEKEITNLNISQDEIKNMLSIRSQDNSNIVVISALSYDPKVAVAVSKAVTKCFISTLNEMTKTNIVGVIDEAKDPAYPLPNDYTRPILLGVVFGIVIAVLIIYIVDFFDTTIRFHEDVEHYTKLSILGVIPKYGIR